MRSLRVLLFEDDAVLQHLLHEVLEADGCRVVQCPSYDALLAAALRQQGDVALLDFWGTSQRTLADPERRQLAALGRAVPTILTSGRAWLRDGTAAEMGLAAVLAAHAAAEPR